jgi:hypothetical protein
MGVKNKGVLLRKTPYKVLSSNNTKYPSSRISLNPLTGFKAGDMVYEVKLPNGCILLVPEDQFNEEDYL